jgi:hypothetical protein
VQTVHRSRAACSTRASGEDWKRSVLPSVRFDFDRALSYARSLPSLIYGGPTSLGVEGCHEPVQTHASI